MTTPFVQYVCTWTQQKLQSNTSLPVLSEGYKALKTLITLWGYDDRSFVLSLGKMEPCAEPLQIWWRFADTGGHKAVVIQLSQSEIL